MLLCFSYMSRASSGFTKLYPIIAFSMNHVIVPVIFLFSAHESYL